MFSVVHYKNVALDSISYLLSYFWYKCSMNSCWIFDCWRIILGNLHDKQEPFHHSIACLHMAFRHGGSIYVE